MDTQPCTIKQNASPGKGGCHLSTSTLSLEPLCTVGSVCQWRALEMTSQSMQLGVSLISRGSDKLALFRNKM